MSESVSVVVGKRELKSIPIDLIASSPNPSREVFEDISALASTIKRHGLLQPLLVKKRDDAYGWEVVVGERRLRACRKAGLQRVPCIEVDGVSEEQVLQWQLVENLQRSDLRVFEEIRLIETLQKRFGLTHEKIAIKTGLSHGTVQNYLTITQLPDDIQRLIVRKTRDKRALTITKALMLARANLPADELKEMVEFIRRQGLNQAGLAKKLAQRGSSKVHRVARARVYWRELTRPLREYARYWSDYCQLREWDDVESHHLEVHVSLPKDLQEEARNE